MRAPEVRAIAASRCLPCRYSTSCRALASSVTWKLSPASGIPCNPNTSMGVEGGASFAGRPRSSNKARTLPKTAPQIKKSPRFKVPFWIRMLATGPRPLSTRDSRTVPVAGASGLAFNSRSSAKASKVSSSLSIPVFFLGGNFDALGVATPIRGQQTVIGELAFYALGLGFGLVDFVYRHDDRDVG